MSSDKKKTRKLHFLSKDRAESAKFSNQYNGTIRCSYPGILFFSFPPVMTENKLLLVGASSFAKLRKRGAYYVDKTSFIPKILYDGNDISLITRPRRFGKTLMQRTLQSFFDINYANPEDRSETEALFKGLDVASDTAFCDAHLGRHPVVFLSFKEICNNTFEEAVSALSALMADAVDHFTPLLTHPKLSEKLRSDLKKCTELKEFSTQKQKTFLADSLKNLVQALSTAYDRSVIVLIDEYDVPFHYARTNGYYADLLPLIRVMLSNALKDDNDFVFKTVVTGCLRLAKESVFTGLNHFGCHPLSGSSLSAAVGFTPAEAEQVLTDFGLSQHGPDVRRHYDGYRFGTQEIYCPWDLMCFCRDAVDKENVTFPNYWIHTSSNDLISEFLRCADESHLEALRALLNGKPVRAPITEDLSFAEIDASHSAAQMLSLLYCTGYLTSSGIGSDGQFQLRIPNHEVRDCFERQIALYFSDQSDDYVHVGRSLAKALAEGNGALANDLLQDFLTRIISVRDTGAESFYHGTVLGLLGSALRRSLKSNAEAGDGYSDIQFLDYASNTAVILELKKTENLASLEATAAQALQQIHDRRYYAEYLNAGVGKLQLYGIAFCGKACRCTRETLDACDKTCR